MMRNIPYIIAVLAIASWCTAGERQFSEGVKIQADGKDVNVRIGHLVPCTTDWNGDGKKDLLVGQFDGGKIRLYLNQGTDAAPVFNDFSYLQAGGNEIRLSAG